MKNTARRTFRWVIMALSLVALPSLVWWNWPKPRAAVYNIYRERGRDQTLEALEGYRKQSSDHFDLYFVDKDKNVTELILETAEQVYEPVVAEVGFRPPGKIPLIVYSSRDDLRRAFGWGKSESAMGVYWSGTIRLLSPNVWVNASGSRERKRVFQKMNPLAHELTHYLLDYYTAGNYPRWFTEGLAQRVEHTVTGYLWIEPDSTLRQALYTLVDLHDRFDALSNQPLAYRQSFLLVDFIAKKYGEDALTRIVTMLADGTDFNKAVQVSVGRSPGQVFNEWMSWLQAHLDQLEPAT